jgi:hypothetical protein
MAINRALPTILEQWEITAEELTLLVQRNPSLRGIMLGYVAEFKLLRCLTSRSTDLQDVGKADNHGRTSKGDRIVVFRQHRIKVESKSLQTNSIRQEADPATGEAYWLGKAQVDASDRRKVTFPDGSTLETTCLLCGEFDLLAVNCFAFEKKWHFAFARNADLPHSTFKKYTDYQRHHLLASLVTVTWPPRPPFYSDPLPVLEAIARDRKR